MCNMSTGIPQHKNFCCIYGRLSPFKLTSLPASWLCYGKTKQAMSSSSKPLNSKRTRSAFTSLKSCPCPAVTYRFLPEPISTNLRLYEAAFWPFCERELPITRKYRLSMHKIMPTRTLSENTWRLDSYSDEDAAQERCTIDGSEWHNVHEVYDLHELCNVHKVLLTAEQRYASDKFNLR